MDPLLVLQHELKNKNQASTDAPLVDAVKVPTGMGPKRFPFFEKRHVAALAVMCFSAATLIAVFLIVATRPPEVFPSGAFLDIKAGNFDDVSAFLESKQVIRSPFVFKVLARITGKTDIKAGLYSFEKPLYAFTVLDRLERGFTNVERVRITIPEGMTIEQIAAIVHTAIPEISQKKFISLAKGKEGYLFPETYLVLPNSTAELLITMMTDTFAKVMKSIQGDLVRFGKSERDVIIMASILEEEGNTTDSRQMISDILWRRIKIGMPLQVDATFLYINGKKTYELTKEDLRSTSPYNTYMYKGLPPGPISNPGLDSILAAVRPRKNDFWYYLSDSKGLVYYAETYNEHLANKAAHIK